MSEMEFHEFLNILRSGDAKAVEGLLSDIEPGLRWTIRSHLFGENARRIVDTSDILQSLLKDFLAHNAAGQTEVSAEKLKAYLATAAQYKVAAKARKERRRAGGLEDVAEPESTEPASAQRVEDDDLIDAIRSRLDADSRRLFDLSKQGRTWRMIADEIGGHPDTLRIQLRRSVATALSEIRDVGNNDST